MGEDVHRVEEVAHRDMAFECPESNMSQVTFEKGMDWSHCPYCGARLEVDDDD